MTADPSNPQKPSAAFGDAPLLRATSAATSATASNGAASQGRVRPKLLRNGFVQAALLLAALSIVGSVVLPIAYVFSGSTGLAAAALAAGLALAGGWSALALLHLLGRPEQMAARVLGSIAVAMAIPLGGGLAVHVSGGPLAHSGFLYYLVVFYLAMLALKTWAALGFAAAPPNVVRCKEGSAI